MGMSVLLVLLAVVVVLPTQCSALLRYVSFSSASSLKANVFKVNASANVSANVSAHWQLEYGRLSKSADDALQMGLRAKDASPSPEEQQCEIGRQYTPTPSLCTQGNDFIPRPKLQTYLKEFKKLWVDFKAQLPGETCCMGINHQFAIYTAVKELQPLVIIESGVAAGRGTWLLRYSAGPHVPIFSLDPGDPIAMYGPSPPGRGWKDNGGRTTYLTGSNFQDLAMVRWDVLIPDPAIRARTLVILDDHQSSIERLKMLRNWGFRYAFYEDNYPFGVATSADKVTCWKMGASMPRVFTKALHGDAYSPNTVCSAVPPGWNFVLEKDRFGAKCKFLTLDQHGQNVKWFQENLKSYFEFPPIFSRCTGLSRDPLLGTDASVLSSWGFPEPLYELWQYGHLYPALMDLKPLSTEVRKTFVNNAWVESSEQSDGKQAALQGIATIYNEMQTGQWP
jgi:hypothetical protein